MPPRRLAIVSARDTQLSLADRAVRESVERLVERRTSTRAARNGARKGARSDRPDALTRPSQGESMADQVHHEGRRWDIRPKHVVVGVLVLLLIVFALLNTHEVNLDFIVGDADLSLIVVIVGSALIGFAVGYVVKARGGND